MFLRLCEPMKLPAEQRLPAGTAKIVSEQFEDISSCRRLRVIFRQLHYLKDGRLDEKNMIERFESGALRADYPFASVARDFKLIEDRTKTILIGKENEGG